MEKLLTVSIAAYNVSAYLRKALDSLCVPDLLGELEVLVVNDGSTDDTPDIARDYERRYPGTFRLIDKENGGYGSTVNCGVREARGKYFRLLDGDDYFDPANFLAFFRQLRTSTADLLLTPFSKKRDVEGSAPELKEQAWHSLIGRVLTPSETDTPLICGIWHMTVLTERIRRNLVKLPRHTLYTDQLFAFCAMAGASKIAFCGEAVYVYRVGRDGQSISAKSLRAHYADELKVLKKMLRLYAKSPLVTDENRAMLLIRMGRYYYFGYRTVCLLLRSAEHYRLLKSVERTAKKWCPDVYEEAGRQSLKIRLMRRFGGLFYCAAAGRESLWAK